MYIKDSIVYYGIDGNDKNKYYYTVKNNYDCYLLYNVFEKKFSCWRYSDSSQIQNFEIKLNRDYTLSSVSYKPVPTERVAILHLANHRFTSIFDKTAQTTRYVVDETKPMMGETQLEVRGQHPIIPGTIIITGTPSRQ